MNSLSLILSLVLNVHAQAVPLTDQQVVTLTILAEARGEGERGMLACANVIRTRTLKRKQSPSSVCTSPKQFSCWNSGAPSISLLKCKEAAYASRLALALVKKDWLPDVTKGSNHYCRYDRHPSWAKSKFVTVRIKNHVFYKI